MWTEKKEYGKKILWKTFLVLFKIGCIYWRIHSWRAKEVMVNSRNCEWSKHWKLRERKKMCSSLFPILAQTKVMTLTQKLFLWKYEDKITKIWLTFDIKTFSFVRILFPWWLSVLFMGKFMSEYESWDFGKHLSAINIAPYSLGRTCGYGLSSLRISKKFDVLLLTDKIHCHILIDNVPKKTHPNSYLFLKKPSQENNSNKL